MSHVPFLFGAGLAIAAVLGSLCIWSRRRLSVKVVALGLIVLYLPIAYASLVDLLGRPKPVAMERGGNGMDEAVVLSSRLVEGEAIYLWLEIPGVNTPRAYALPWSDKRARELHEAKRQAESSGTELNVSNLFESPLDGDDHRMFYPAPQQALPPKQAQGPQSIVVR